MSETDIPQGGRLARLFGRMRLRHKLAASLSIAALLPVLVASSVAVSVLLRNLDGGLRDDTERQLGVGLNLLLRTVERLGHDAIRLSSAGDLSRALNLGPDHVNEFLARESPHLPSSLVQIADERGVIITERVIGGVESRFAGLRVDTQSQSMRAGLAFERKVTLVRVGDQLVIRAVAPVVDASYMLQGVVVVSVPLDGAFADGVKGALGTDVLIFVGDGSGAQSASTTFLDEMGSRRQVEANARVAMRLVRGSSVVANDTILGREYAVGYTPLTNLNGEPVGVFAVAVDREPLVSAKSAATRSLILGAAGAFIFALGLASLLSRRITRPIADLHTGAIAIARGDLEHRIEVTEGDEIGDLADAFGHMTRALKENQARLAARMREIVALHDAGRAVSSSINRNQVMRKVVDSVARVLDVRLCALWLVDNPDRVDRDEPVVRIAAVRAKNLELRTTLAGDEGKELAAPLAGIAADVARARATLRVDRIADDKRRREAAIAAGITGSLLATPLERKGAVVGVIIVGRAREAAPFSEANSNLLATFADQAATAIENARLFDEVREFNEELEAKVNLRTSELTAINAELGRTITELRETQSQLILSERLAGLGLLVAGVAHEINSPSAAIRGSVDAMEDNVQRLAQRAGMLADAEASPERRRELVAAASEL
ncbi:MAG TPA: GAF domain-containing protein, partial [Kofleriaceae bacterium]|nr:GAF domain-containing protein [Kofleriaceae bacterium]